MLLLHQRRGAGHDGRGKAGALRNRVSIGTVESAVRIVTLGRQIQVCPHRRDIGLDAADEGGPARRKIRDCVGGSINGQDEGIDDYGEAGMRVDKRLEGLAAGDADEDGGNRGIGQARGTVRGIGVGIPEDDAGGAGILRVGHLHDEVAVATLYEREVAMERSGGQGGAGK